tara:strand:+ start:253 stop:1461 length:1209 start_codon:yes stop_codon:yes gene_type:complete
MAEDSRKMRLVGSFDEYGYRQGLAGSLAQGLFKAAQPTRYPRSVGERLIGGVFDGLATHRNMRIQDDLAIAEREKREIEMEELRRNRNISRQLDELRTNAMTGDFLGRTLGTADYMQQLAQITGDPTAMAEAMKFRRLGVEALDSSIQKELLQYGIDPQKVAEVNRTGDFNRYPEISQKIQEIREIKDEEKQVELELQRANIDQKNEELLQKQIKSYSDAEKEWLRLGNVSENLDRKTNELVADLENLLDPKTDVGKALANAAGGTRRESLENWLVPQQKETLIGALDSIKSRIAFSELIKIKQQGGSLGALSDREFQALADNIAALNVNLTPKQLIRQVRTIIKRVKTSRDAYVSAADEERESQSAIAIRFGARLNNRKNENFNFNLAKFDEGEIEGEIRK